MKYTITYDDGHTETVKVKPRHYTKAERCGRSVATDSSLENSFYLAWLAVGGDGTVEDFDEWLNVVDDVVSETEPKRDGDGIDDVGPISGESQP